MTVYIFDMYKTDGGVCTMLHVRGTTLWYDVYWCTSDGTGFYPCGWDEVHAPRNYSLIAKNVVFK